MRENSLQEGYAGLNDEALVRAFQAGNAEAFSELVARYLRLVRLKACSFREIFSLEQEDLCQEGLLGLLDAANAYRPDGGATFATFAGRCITNRIVSAVRRSASQKNSLLNHAVPFDEMATTQVDEAANPQSLLEERDDRREMLEAMHISLSPFERRILNLYLGGYKRAEIEEKLGISVRAFDNAMARVRKKLRQK